MPGHRPFSLVDRRNFAELLSARGPQPNIIAMEVRIMKTLLNMAVAATLLAALPAWACTPEEATAKREQLAEEVTKLTQQNPEKAKEINEELQNMKLETASADLPDKCQLIDQRLTELKEAIDKTKN
jgi:tRNA A37 N6-isopentenylltransferase MiaA